MFAFLGGKADSLITLCREDPVWPGGRHRPVKTSKEGYPYMYV